MRAALATSFRAVGRGGAAGLLTWNSLSWNFDEENLSGSWPPQQVFNVLDVNFFADATAYDIDEFHCMACYCIVGGGSRFLTLTTATRNGYFLISHQDQLRLF